MIVRPHQQGRGVVCLTGDVHHMSLRTRDQRSLGTTEAEAAGHYLTIAERWGLPITLFITGKLLEEEGAHVRALKDLGEVEFGGHTYDAFQSDWIYKISGRFIRAQNGPAFWQDRSVSKTKRLLEKSLTSKVLCWRNHSYRRDRNTPGILRRHGFVFWSDFVDPDCSAPYEVDGLIRVPINTLPDHEHMLHGDTAKASLPMANQHGQPLPRPTFTAREWVERILKQVEAIVSAGGVATVLAHPACMAIADNFVSFDALCRGLAVYNGVLMHKVMARETKYVRGAEDGHKER